MQRCFFNYSIVICLVINLVLWNFVRTRYCSFNDLDRGNFARQEFGTATRELAFSSYILFICTKFLYTNGRSFQKHSKARTYSGVVWDSI